MHQFFVFFFWLAFLARFYPTSILHFLSCLLAGVCVKSAPKRTLTLGFWGDNRVEQTLTGHISSAGDTPRRRRPGCQILCEPSERFPRQRHGRHRAPT
jgi:hypothetical protein